MRRSCVVLLIAGSLWLSLAPVAAKPVEPVAVDAGGYHDHAGLSAKIDRLRSRYPRACVTRSIGTSREGRAIWALRVALDGGADPDSRPALLIVANIDGDHLVGSEVALEVAERLLTAADEGDEAAAAFLSRSTLYVVPRVNPDAAERWFAAVRSDRRRNVRPDDRDRDGALDEDPPDDLNGDGLITMMRVPDPEKADLMADSQEPRLEVKPDRDKGERAGFFILVEGLDDDGDGEFNEDDLGGVDLNMNFMHGYKEHADGAGPYQVSEPESLALLRFVLEHQNIAAVLTYGVHDTLSKPPDGKGAYPSSAPKTIDEKDAGLYKQISERFREITGLEEVAAPAAEGAFFAWAYAQFGVPSFATPLWARPKPEQEEEKEPGEPGPEGEAPPAEAAAEPGEALTPSGIGNISQETMDELIAHAESQGMTVTDDMLSQLTPTMVEGFARRAGIEIRRVKGAAGKGAAASKDDAAWLAYSDDERGGAGFIAWTPFDHPDLGPVEIGGWVPYFRTNPPPEAIDGIASKQVEFVLDLAGRLPEVSLSDPDVTRLAPGLYEVKAALVNDGYLPAGTAMAVANRRARPFVVRLSTPDERIVTGERVHKAWAIPGSGGREAMRWIIRARDGSDLTITVFSEKYGESERTIRLEAAPPQGDQP